MNNLNLKKRIREVLHYNDVPKEGERIETSILDLKFKVSSDNEKVVGRSKEN